MPELSLQEILFNFRAERLRLFREQQTRWVELLKYEAVLSKSEFRMLHLELGHVRLSFVMEKTFCVLCGHLAQAEEGSHDKFRIM